MLAQQTEGNYAFDYFARVRVGGLLGTAPIESDLVRPYSSREFRIIKNSWLNLSISSHILPVRLSQYTGKKPSILRNPTTRAAKVSGSGGAER